METYKVANKGSLVAKKEFNNVKWLASAVSTDFSRKYIDFIYSDNDCAVSTDGYRLHYIDKKQEPCFIPEGLWAVKQCNQKEIVLEKTDYHLTDYPNFKNIMPDLQVYTMQDITLKNGNDTELAKSVFEIAKKMICVNPFFLEDALKNHPMRWAYKNETSPVLLQDQEEHYKALIMPIIQD